jgi:hypothetical protein
MQALLLLCNNFIIITIIITTTTTATNIIIIIIIIFTAPQRCSPAFCPRRRQPSSAIQRERALKFNKQSSQSNVNMQQLKKCPGSIIADSEGNATVDEQ